MSEVDIKNFLGSHVLQHGVQRVPTTEALFLHPVPG